MSGGMKVWSLLVGFLLVAGAQAQLLPPEQRPVPVDGFAAIVNDRIITAGEVLTSIDPKRQELMQTIPDKRELQRKLQELYEAGLTAAIERALILEAFEESEIQLPENLVGERVNEIINKRFADDRAAFEQALVEEGVSLRERRDQIRENIQFQIMRRREVYDRVAVLPREIRELYEEQVKASKVEKEVRLRAIAKKRPEGRDEQTKVLRELYEIKLKLQDGADFALMAKAHSQEQHASEGGDFGWTKMGYLKPELREAVEELAAGEFSNVVRSGDLYYVLKVEGFKDGGPRSLKEMQSELEAQLRSAKQNELYDDWINRLRTKYHVKRF